MAAKTREMVYTENMLVVQAASREVDGAIDLREVATEVVQSDLLPGQIQIEAQIEWTRDKLAHLLNHKGPAAARRRHNGEDRQIDLFGFEGIQTRYSHGGKMCDIDTIPDVALLDHAMTFEQIGETYQNHADELRGYVEARSAARLEWIIARAEANA